VTRPDSEHAEPAPNAAEARPSGSRDRRGRFVVGNREGAATARPWARAGLTPREVRLRASFARRLEAAGAGSRRWCIYRAGQAVTALRAISLLRSADGAAFLENLRELQAAEALVTRVETECGGSGDAWAKSRGPAGPRPGRSFMPIPRACRTDDDAEDDLEAPEPEDAEDAEEPEDERDERDSGPGRFEKFADWSRRKRAEERAASTSDDVDDLEERRP
jgi:hypothetical protein